MTRKLQHATPAERAAHRQKQAERKALEERENDAIVRQVLETTTGLAEQDFDVVVIPSGHADTSELPHERIQEYAEHLRRVTSAAHHSADKFPTDKTPRHRPTPRFHVRRLHTAPYQERLRRRAGHRAYRPSTFHRRPECPY